MLAKLLSYVVINIPLSCKMDVGLGLFSQISISKIFVAVLLEVYVCVCKHNVVYVCCVTVQYTYIYCV